VLLALFQRAAPLMCAGRLSLNRLSIDKGNKSCYASRLGESSVLFPQCGCLLET
jgi:hypothetical protein